MLTTLLIFALILALVIWASDYLPAPFPMVVKLIAVVIFIIKLLEFI